MEKIRIGIIGFGGAAQALSLIYQNKANCEIVSVFDTDKQGLSRASSICSKANLTTDYHEFYKVPMDVVTICSPDKTHADYLVDAVVKKKHVLCEKPLTDSVEGIRKILNAVNNNPEIKVAVQHQMRFLPLHQKIKKIIQDGELGKLSYLEGFYVHNLQERAFENHIWRRIDNATPLVYSGVHFVDLLRWFMEEEIVEISGFANNINFPEYPESDLNVNTFTFESGAIGKVITAFGAQRPQDHSIQIYGSKKSIKDNLLFDRRNFSIIAEPQSNTLKNRRFAFFKDNVVKVYAKIFKGLMNSYPLNAQYSIASYPIRLYEHQMAVEKSVDNFISAIMNDTPLTSSVYEGAKSVAACLAGVEAYRTKTIVKVDNFFPKDL